MCGEGHDGWYAPSWLAWKHRRARFRCKGCLMVLRGQIPPPLLEHGDKLMSGEEVADILRLTNGQVHELVKQQRLVPANGRRQRLGDMRFRARSVVAFLREDIPEEPAPRVTLEQMFEEADQAGRRLQEKHDLEQRAAEKEEETRRAEEKVEMEVADALEMAGVPAVPAEITDPPVAEESEGTVADMLSFDASRELLSRSWGWFYDRIKDGSITPVQTPGGRRCLRADVLALKELDEENGRGPWGVREPKKAAKKPEKIVKKPKKNAEKPKPVQKPASPSKTELDTDYRELMQRLKVYLRREKIAKLTVEKTDNDDSYEVTVVRHVVHENKDWI